MKSHWILTYESRGSSILCDIIQKTLDLSPKMEEHLDKIPINYSLAFDPNKLTNISTTWNQFKRNIDDPKILNKYDLNLVRLRRKNIFARTISLYLKIERTKWKLPPTNINIPFNSEKVLWIYKSISNEWDEWDALISGKKCIDVEYEELIKSPNVICKNILDFWGYNVPIESIQNSTTNDASNLEYEHKLRNIIFGKGKVFI